MPLLDHFQPPLLGTRHWESFHALWAGGMAEWLNLKLLSEGYFAEVQVHIGGRIEVDVATFDRDPLSRVVRVREENASVATLTAPVQVWTPTAPDVRFPAVFPDVVEVLVYSEEAGPTLVGAVELVSSGNKDRPEARRAFAAKCAAYLQDGVGLVVVDIVTSRRANLHNELIGLLELGDEFRMPAELSLYATAYRPVRRPSEEATDAWLARVGVGEPLPTLPLFLRRGPCLPIDLEASYADVCRRARLA